MFESYKNHVEKSLQLAENYQSKITNDIINLHGMSGYKTRHFYNNIVNMEDARYLEIGCWKGSSICAAMCNNKAKVVCIDNWSQFGYPKGEFLINFEKFKGNNDALFIEADCFKLDISTLPKFNIYMYDGDHRFEDQSMALTYYYDCLDDIFIYIVDDWNIDCIRDGTYDGINKSNLKILYQKEIRLTWDNTYTPESEATINWWNGMSVFILQK